MKTSMLGTTAILSGVLLISWRGPWILEADLDLPSTSALPSGAVSPNIAATTLKGTVDTLATFRLGDKAKVRIVAGAGAWANTPLPKHFHSDAGMMSDYVINATANEIGETANDANPISIGIDYVRLGIDANGNGIDAEASRVLDAGAEHSGRDWYVDANGVTQVASWPAATPSDDVEVLDFDEEMQKLVLSSDSIVWPGTTFTDSRFGTLTVRDVELTFTAEKFRSVAWCSSSSTSRLQKEWRRALVQKDYAQLIRYRITQQNSDGRLQLTAVDPSDGFPQTLPLSVWPGMAGLSAKYVTGTVVLVEFIGRDPKNPIVRGFDGSAPTQLNLDATTKIAIGASCPNTSIGSAPLPAALGIETTAVVTALNAFCVSVGAAATTNPALYAPFAAALVTAASTLSTAIGTLLAEINAEETNIT